MKKEYNWGGIIIISSIIIFVITAFYPYVLKNILGFNFSENDVSVWGDSFGGLNTLFSGLAFGLLIITAWMQKIDLKATQQELELTRKEFERNRLTNIVFQYVESLENLIELFSIPKKYKESYRESFKDSNYDKVVGNRAIMFVMSEIHDCYTEEDEKIYYKEDYERSSKIWILGTIDLSVFLKSLLDKWDSFKSIIEKSSLDDDEKDQMIFIFKSNVSTNLKFFISDLKDVLDMNIIIPKSLPNNVKESILDIESKIYRVELKKDIENIQDLIK